MSGPQKKLNLCVFRCFLSQLLLEAFDLGTSIIVLWPDLASSHGDVGARFRNGEILPAHPLPPPGKPSDVVVPPQLVPPDFFRLVILSG